MTRPVINLLFHCGHRHLTRPFTPLSQIGVPRGETYVVCLDCTKQFAYDCERDAGLERLSTTRTVLA